MNRPVLIAVLASLGALSVNSAEAARKPTVAIIPAQYFSADRESARKVTLGLVDQFERQGYRVVPLSRSEATFRSRGLSARKHYSDGTVLRFGRALGADVVAYPRMLALGLQAVERKRGEPTRPAAVVHLRVLNTRTSAPLYTRQVAYEFTPNWINRDDYRLTQDQADGAARQVSRLYFQRVAGSRQESRGR